MEQPHHAVQKSARRHILSGEQTWGAILLLSSRLGFSSPLVDLKTGNGKDRRVVIDVTVGTLVRGAH
jgi:hypothetical protein